MDLRFKIIAHLKIYKTLIKTEKNVYKTELA